MQTQCPASRITPFINGADRLVGVAVVIAITLVPVTAQIHPNFSGTWSMDLTRSDAAVQAEPSGPTTVTIEQSSTELTMTIARDGKSGTIIYRLDGAPTAVPGGTATSHWDGAGLVTELVRTISGQTVTTQEVRRLSAGGDEMRVDTVLVVQHGYTQKGSQNYGAAKDVYTRVR